MSAKITIGLYEMPSATMYEDNTLPDIGTNNQLKMNVSPGRGMEEKEIANLGKGFVKTILPYTIKDNYDRVKKPRKFISVVMENEYLKATILPEIGGRVWSLFDKKGNRELLHENHVFQPCNFALRNAWVAGGIEYSCGVRGHNVHTLDTFFCAINNYKDGRKTVKLYEYERIRGLVYSIEFFLPDRCDSLLAQVTVENTSDKEKWMYWYTNIALREEPGLRVLVPADTYLRTDYDVDKGTHSLSLNGHVDSDIINSSYPSRNEGFRDFFYKIPEDSEKWITTVDKNGCGFSFTSTKMLKGRKLFVLGTRNSASRNWAKFLGKENDFYIELQAGLSFHQFEHIRMPSDTVWQWTEAYSPFNGDPEKVHNPDIKAAQKYAGANVKMHGAEIEKNDFFKGICRENLQSEELVTLGSGWGYIENVIRERLGEKEISASCAFPRSSVSEIEAEWLYLIEKGSFPSEDVTAPLRSFLTGDYVCSLLEKAIKENKAGAYTYLQYGTTLYALDRQEEAADAWEKSFQISPNPWAARNIAMIKRCGDDLESACGYMQKAIAINWEYRPLVIECAKLFTSANKYAEWIEIYNKLNSKLKAEGRIKYLTAKAYIALDMLAKAEELVNKDLIINDLQEGELSLEYLWIELFSKKLKKENSGWHGDLDKLLELYPLPPELNFRIQKIVNK